MKSKVKILDDFIKGFDHDRKVTMDLHRLDNLCNFGIVWSNWSTTKLQVHLTRVYLVISCV